MTVMIWFHGTDQKAAQKILKTGFKKGTYFAAHLEDAIEFGGDHVFEVALSFKEGDSSEWQITVARPVPPRFIVRLQRHAPVTVRDFPDVRRRMFEANQEDLQAKENAL